MNLFRNRLLIMTLAYSLTLFSFYLIYGKALSSGGIELIAGGLVLSVLATQRRYVRIRLWIPFVMIIFSYEELGGIYHAAVNVRGLYPVFMLDRSLWGFNLTGAVQNALISHQFTSFMTAVYALHLPIVVFTAVSLWYVERRAYWKYVYAVSLVAFLSFFTFLALPSAPPWYTGQALNLLSSGSAHSSLYASLSGIVESDPFAAFPSLHAALALLFLYGMWSAKRSYGLAALPVVGLVLMSTVYLGQHFVVDLLAGGFYALVGVIFANRCTP